MKFYMAPMEGITGHIFRNALNEFFGEGIDKFYTPFLVPHTKKTLSSKENKEVSVDNNKGINLVPQILTNNADDFTYTKDKLRALGYKEVNLNLGCPSRTVVTKQRGAGALSDLDMLDKLLDGIYSKGDEYISIKTRMGVNDVNEFEKILEIYNKYPIYELTIHARVMSEMYKGKPHVKECIEAASKCKFPVCYNGDIFSLDDYNNLESIIENQSLDGLHNVDAVMIGRGILKNPALIRELTGGSGASVPEISGMLDKLLNDYLKEFSGQTQVLFKMKEVWSYLREMFPNKDKEFKKLFKCKSVEEYSIIANSILK